MQIAKHKETRFMKPLLNVSLSQRAVTTVQYDAVIVGVGPYGLSTALLRRICGHIVLNVAMFGVPLSCSSDEGRCRPFPYPSIHWSIALKREKFLSQQTTARVQE